LHIHPARGTLAALMTPPLFQLARGSAWLVVLALVCPACATLASSPSWTGGGLSMATSLRQREEDAELAKEMKLISGQPSRIGAKHILVMHAESQRRPRT